MQAGNIGGMNSMAQCSQICHCEAPKGPWRPEREARGSALGVQSREGTSSSYKVPIKTYKPIASVAAFPAQPLAALPPYGCGVPLADCERPAGWQYLRHKFIGAMPSSLSLRGGRRPTWQSRSTRPDHRKAIGENAAAFPRLHPKGTSSRFALRAPRPLRGLAMTRPEAFRILHFSVFRIHSFPCRSPATHD